MKLRQMVIGCAALIVGSQAFAVREGGGGAAVVCKGASGNITSVKLLDLYQGAMLPPGGWGVPITRSNLAVDKQIDTALARLDKFTAYDIKQYLARVKAKWTRLASNQSMHKTYDLGTDAVVIEDGCYPEWLAFDSEGSLVVVSKLFDKMSPTDQAALYLHEAIYEYARENIHEIDSLRTRKLVALLFAKYNDVDKIKTQSDFIVTKMVQNITETESSYVERAAIENFNAEYTLTLQIPTKEKNQTTLSYGLYCYEGAGQATFDWQHPMQQASYADIDPKLLETTPVVLAANSNCRVLVIGIRNALPGKYDPVYFTLKVNGRVLKTGGPVNYVERHHIYLYPGL